MKVPILCTEFVEGDIRKLSDFQVSVLYDLRFSLPEDLSGKSLVAGVCACSDDPPISIGVSNPPVR
jgi:hypothetical protein